MSVAIVVGAHDFEAALRCVRCLTDLRYAMRHPSVPCLPEKMRERNRRRIGLVLYDEAEKDRRVREWGYLVQLMLLRIMPDEYERLMASEKYAGDRAFTAWLESSSQEGHASSRA